MTEYRTLLSNFIKKSATIGLLRNDGTVDTTDYVSTSNTEGLIKNDGTIDTTSYLSAHQDITGKEDKSNKVTSLSSSSTDTQYPSAKAVYDLISLIYPIGSIYMSVNSTDPSTFLGGTWEQIKDRFLLGSGDTYANGSTGGSATVTLTSAQSGVPAHTHQYSDYNTTYTLKTTNRKPGTSTAVAYGTSLTSGGGATTRTSQNNTSANASQAHENMPPYMAVYMWKRIG